MKISVARTGDAAEGASIDWLFVKAPVSALPTRLLMPARVRATRVTTGCPWWPVLFKVTAP